MNKALPWLLLLFLASGKKGATKPTVTTSTGVKKTVGTSSTQKAATGQSLVEQERIKAETQRKLSEQQTNRALIEAGQQTANKLIDTIAANWR